MQHAIGMADESGGRHVRNEPGEMSSWCVLKSSLELPAPTCEYCPRDEPSAVRVVRFFNYLRFLPPSQATGQPP
jgi:hypothetical protein